MLKETLSSMFNIQSRTVNNAIIQLGDTDDSGKGKHFKSRFIQPGVAGYPERDENLLITKDSFDRFIHTLKNKPVIINHKDEITEKDKVGEVHNVWYNPDDGWYWCDGVITDKYAMDLIKSHKWSVSCSYDILKADDKGGSENNIKYGMEILDGIFTHLALVKNPRYERANIVFNSKTVIVNDVTDRNGDVHSSTNGQYVSQFKNDSSFDINAYFQQPDVQDNITKSKNNFKNILNQIKKGTISSDLRPIVLFKPTKILTRVGIPDAKVIFDTSKIKTNIAEHNLTYEELETIPALLADPLYIFESNTDDDAFVAVLTDEVKPFIVALKQDEKSIKIQNVIKSSYHKDSPYWVKDQIKGGRLLYDRKKPTRFRQHRAPIAQAKTSSANNIIPPSDTNLNPNVKNSKQTFEEAFTDVFFEALAEVLLETYK